MKTRLLGLVAALSLLGITYTHAGWYVGHSSCGGGWGFGGGYRPTWGYWGPSYYTTWYPPVYSTVYPPAFYSYTTPVNVTSTVIYQQPTNSVLTKVQRQLWNLGYYKGDIDGAFGPVTQRAIETFQRENGLPITGRLDSQTLKRLNVHA